MYLPREALPMQYPSNYLQKGYGSPIKLSELLKAQRMFRRAAENDKLTYP